MDPNILSGSKGQDMGIFGGGAIILSSFANSWGPAGEKAGERGHQDGMSPEPEEPSRQVPWLLTVPGLGVLLVWPAFQSPSWGSGQAWDLKPTLLAGAGRPASY